MKPQEIVTLHADAHEAIRYFYEIGMIDNLHGDQQYYVEALIKFAANKMHIELVG
jgi:hypothetical protein